LRAKHPKVEIESCSGGDGRVDLGILGVTDEVWPSDNTDPFDRLTIQDGFTTRRSFLAAPLPQPPGLALSPAFGEERSGRVDNHGRGEVASQQIRFASGSHPDLPEAHENYNHQLYALIPVFRKRKLAAG